MANQIPTGSATGFLTNGTQNTIYTLYEATLIQGFSDPDGDLLNVIGLYSDSGEISELGGGRWNFTPDTNFSGTVTFDYFVTDNKSGAAQGALNLNIASNNHAPTGNIIIDGFAKAGVMLSVNSTLYDADGINGAVNYQWFVDNSPVANGYNYTVSTTDTGKSITVKASYTDMLGNPETMTSGNVIVQAAPSPTYNLFVDKNSVNEGDTATVTLQTSNVPANTAVFVNVSGNVTAADLNSGYIPTSFFVGADGKATIPLSFLNDKLTEGAENLTFTLSNDSSKSVTINVNDTSMKPVNNPPTGNVSINGDAKVGQTLYVQNNVQDADGFSGQPSFQWFSNGVIINGKTQPNYTLINDDANKNISVQISYTDNLGTAEKVSSSPIFVQAATPTYTLNVDKFNVNEGDTVNLSLQTTNIPAGTEVKFNFGGSISNADTTAGLNLPSFFVGTDGTAKLAMSFVNDKLTEGMENLTATLQNAPNQTVSVNVNDTSIKPANNPPTGNLVINGDAKVGQTLNASNSLADLDGLGALNFQWLSNGAVIYGQTQPNYTLINDDANKNISVQISYTDNLGTVEKVSSSPIFVQAATPTYALSVDKFNVNEGDTATVTLQTSNVPANTAVFVNVSGNVTAADLNSGYIPNSFFVGADGKATIPLSFLNDKLTEGAENLTFTLSNDSSKSVTINVNDTSMKPVNNPPTGNVGINGDAKVGQTLYVQNNVQDLDGVGAFNFQWFSNGVIINGKTQPNYTLINDDDANKNISVQVSYIDNLGTTEKVSSSPIFVQAATPTYNLFVDKFNVNEGDTVNLSLQTTNVPAGTEVKFNFGGSISNADTTAGLNLPSFFVGTDGTAKLAVSFVNDKLIEGMENLTATLQNTPNQTVSVNVNDTSVKPANNPPTGNVSINGNAKVGQTLTAQNNVQDLDGFSGQPSFQWFSNGVMIYGKTQPNYTLINDDANKNISVQISYTDNLGTSEKVSSSPIFVQPAKPTYALSVDRVDVNEGESVYFKITTTNVPTESNIDFPLTFSGSISSADVDNQMLLPRSLWIDKNSTGTIAVSFSNDKLTEGKENLIATLINDASKTVMVNVNDTSMKPVNNYPTGELKIIGDAKIGQNLTVQNTLNDADGLGKIAYQWLKNGVAIFGATQSNYTPTKSDLGKAISVTANYIDGLKNAESITSDPTYVVALDVPIYHLTANKTELDEGATVTFKLETTNLSKGSNVEFDLGGSIADSDIVGGLPTPSFVLDANGNASLSIAFANDKITEGDENFTLTLADDREQMTFLTVHDTGIINHKPTGGVVIQGTLKVGTKLSLLNTLDDADGLGALSYQWLSNGVAIKNATKETYTLTKTDIGKKISVTVSYTDDLDNAEFQTSSETMAIKASIVINGLTKTGDANKNKLIGAEKNDSLLGMAGADTLLGNAGDDQLDGGAGNDSLDGGVGADKLDGGTGNDYYVVDNLKDTVTETDANVKLGGNDSVETVLSYTLGKNIENLILAGIINNNGTGNELNNQITGNVGDNLLKGMAGNDQLAGDGGADTLDGGLGMDTLIGGADDDTYYMNNTEDKIIEAKNGGEDQIIASVDFDLNTSPNVEILILSGAKAINGTGNELNNLLQEIDGGKTANVFDGQAGNDTINGGGGNDTLEGGAGNDVIEGGDGDDVAIFSGAKDDYQITPNSDVTEFVVSYQGNDESILDGEDILTNVENLQFSDGEEIYSIADLILTGVIN